MRIVIVDGEAQVREELIKLLEKSGPEYKVAGTASDGREGYELISEARPDLVIMDVQLSRMGGVTMLKKLRGEGVSCRVIVLTADTDFNKARQAIELSVDNYILKPLKKAQLKKAVESLTKELAEKTRRVEELQAELASKNIRIQELDAAVTGLSAEKEELIAENTAKAETVAEQDKELNTAWFVFGTKKELKDQRILSKSGLFKKGQVLKAADVNLDYFTQIDIRTTREIKLYTTDAEVLTTHPAGSYALEEDGKGQLTLKINNPKSFWSISKYLVIQVK